MKDMWELEKKYPVYEKNNAAIITFLEGAFEHLFKAMQQSAESHDLQGVEEEASISLEEIAGI